MIKQNKPCDIMGMKFTNFAEKNITRYNCNLFFCSSRNFHSRMKSQKSILLFKVQM